MSAGLVLGVAGIGLIGGSIALRAKTCGATVIGFDHDTAALAQAQARGALDEVATDLASLAARCDVLALALPVDATVRALEEPALRLPNLVFDVASAKVVTARAGAHLPQFVPSHPLAGREIEGFAGALGDLFDGRIWVIAPGGEPAARSLLRELIVAWGARPYDLAADEHDRLVAVTSHLPQLLSVVLAARLGVAGRKDPRAYPLCGTGMESMLRLARSPANLWAGIARANAPALVPELRAFARALSDIADGLDRGDTQTLLDAFAAASAALAERDLSTAVQSSSTP